MPSAKYVAATGVPFVDRLRQAVEDLMVSDEHICADRTARQHRSSTGDALWSDLDVALATTLRLDSDYYGDPLTLAEALSGPFTKHWKLLLKEELDSIRALHVFHLVPWSSVPAGCKIVRGKPVFRFKCNENGKPVCFKSLWVCRGFEAVFGQDYTEMMSPTMRTESFRVILHTRVAMAWEAFQVNMKTAYLYGLLPGGEACYMEQPPGFEEPGKEDWVWKLNKGLYGMPQGRRVWNQTMDSHLKSVGFTRVDCEFCIYYWVSSQGVMITSIHVDDFMVIASTCTACKC